MVMDKYINYILKQIYQEVGISIKEGITQEEILKATYKIMSELENDQVAEHLIRNLLENAGDDKIDPDTEVKYKNKDGEEKTTTYKSAMAQKDNTPQKKAALALRDKMSNDDTDEDGEKFSKADQRSMMTPAEREAEAKSKAQKDSQPSTSSYEEVQSEITNLQSDLESQRDMGIAGAGGAVASQGEARYCNAMNTLNVGKFKDDNRQSIDDKKEQLASSKIKAADARDLRALGLDPNSDAGREYIATREVFAEQELDRIKKMKGSVYYKKGKAGFAENDEAYLEWARVAYDGALATRKILKENTPLDTSKPHTTLQSTTELDDKVEGMLQLEAAKAKSEGKVDLAKHYENEIKSFQKYRKYHDTYVVGEDINGNMTVVSVSNKKDSALRDPQNNTTPAARFNTIKSQYGEKVAKRVVKSIDRGIKEVSDVKMATINKSNEVEIDNSYVAICETPDMKKYMDKLKSNRGFLGHLESKGINVSKVSTKDLLVEMQNYSKGLVANGKKPAYEPFGKISIKIGEFTQKGSFKKKYPNIDFESQSVNDCIQIKEEEKDVVNSSHKKVVDEVAAADAEMGFPKDGVNGPHTKGYIGTVMDAMHFDSYIDGGDGKMIIQMGIRGAQPGDLRGCLAEQSGYTGDTTTQEGRDGLKKHLRERCKVDAESGAILIKDSNGTRSLVEDTWRTAGTSQKVASGYGSDMRKCISGKVDSRRQK